MAPDLQALEQRLTVLEKLVAELQASRTAKPARWWDRLAGSVTDDEAFAEAMRLGREFRRTGRLPDDVDSQP